MGLVRYRQWIIFPYGENGEISVFAELSENY